MYPGCDVQRISKMPVPIHHGLYGMHFGIKVMPFNCQD